MTQLSWFSVSLAASVVCFVGGLLIGAQYSAIKAEGELAFVKVQADEFQNEAMIARAKLAESQYRHEKCLERNREWSRGR